MKIFVTGASSTPGYKIMHILKLKGYKVYAQYNRNKVDVEDVESFKLDLTNFSRVIDVLDEVKPDAIIHAAAIGDVDLCEENKELAIRVNYEVTKILAKFSLRRGAYFIYISTDYVFDGEKGLYSEEYPPNPINFYGLTKLLGEVATSSILDNYIIVRTSQIYGFGMGRKNFGKYVVEALSRGEKVKAFIDQWLSPTLNTLLAEGVAELIEKNFTGLIHIAGERIDRYNFAKAIAKKFRFNEDLIEPISMRDVVFKARRPRDSSLSSAKARGVLKTNFYSLEYSLSRLYDEWVKLQS